jgi:hypothetical protein
MNCPHCQKELPENYDAAYCLFCGRSYSPEVNQTLQTVPSVRLNVKVFFLLLFMPPVATLISAWVNHTQNESCSVIIGFFGGGAAGIACGIMLGLRVGNTVLARIGLGMLFSAVFAIVCIALCFLGCNLGGYQMRLG